MYEAGVPNQTRGETTTLVHDSKTNSQRFTLVRLENPAGDQPAGK